MSFISMRLGDHHKEKYIFDEFLELAGNHKEICEEVWFSSDYGFQKLDEHKISAEMMAQAVDQVRSISLKASLQISNTLGHGDYNKNLDFSGITWQRMVGHDGVVAGYSNCPRDPDFLQYIKEVTSIYAVWKPDTVWVDDDLRMNQHQPVSWGCFCDRCINEFSKQQGVHWDREQLVKAINDPDDWSWRKKWTKFGNDSLCLVMETIAKAVVSVSPESTIGLEHAGVDYVIYSGEEYIKEIADTVLRITGKKMLCRPGGGYYCDRSPYGMLEKSYQMDLSISNMCDFIEDIRPEIEAFPHTAMNKTPHSLAVETMLYLANGCNAISYAIMMMGNERPSYYDSMLKRFEQWLPLWRRYVESNKDTFPSGVRICYNGRQFERKLSYGENAFNWTMPLPVSISGMMSLGIPMTFRKENNRATILMAEVADGMTEDELRVIFAGGVITDGDVIERLQERGLSHLTGVTAEKADDTLVGEKLTTHKINGGNAGRLWIQFATTGLKRLHKINSCNPHTDIIGEYVMVDGSKAGTASIVTETPLGGRLAVFGYNLWESVVNTARRYQLAAAIEWISRGQLPVFADAISPIVLIPRIDKEGKLRSVFVLNPSIDYLSGVKLHLRKTYGDKIIWLSQGSPDLNLDSESINEENIVSIPPIAPWSVGVMEIVR